MDFNDFSTRPLDFLRNNLVVMSFTRTATSPSGPRWDGVHPMTLVKSANKAVDTAGKSIDRWRIERPDAWNGGPDGATVFDAYWCHYDTDELHLQIVEDAASMMFTPRMDGCSFGVGSATPSGARAVGHANVSRTAATPTGFQTQQTTQNAHLTGALGPTAALIDASTYSQLGSGNSGTTFGLRNPANGQWSFYTLAYNGDRHLGVTQIV